MGPIDTKKAETMAEGRRFTPTEVNRIRRRLGWNLQGPRKLPVPQVKAESVIIIEDITGATFKACVSKVKADGRVALVSGAPPLPEYAEGEYLGIGEEVYEVRRSAPTSMGLRLITGVDWAMVKKHMENARAQALKAPPMTATEIEAGLKRAGDRIGTALERIVGMDKIIGKTEAALAGGTASQLARRARKENRRRGLAERRLANQVAAAVSRAKPGSIGAAIAERS